ncbi:topoisomerase C-terminal repeat-containing protein [Clostridium algoriphilum]|nr:topoisomerase C-terminal repeat-containing protein [Clostridium algoriphilum]
MVENAKAYGCNQWKEGCKFTIWKTIAGKKLTEKQAIQLIEKGKTNKIKGFKNKAGKKFDASLRLEIRQVKFDFNN